MRFHCTVVCNICLVASSFYDYQNSRREYFIIDVGHFEFVYFSLHFLEAPNPIFIHNIMF